MLEGGWWREREGRRGVVECWREGGRQCQWTLTCLPAEMKRAAVMNEM